MVRSARVLLLLAVVAVSCTPAAAEPDERVIGVVLETMPTTSSVAPTTTTEPLTATSSSTTTTTLAPDPHRTWVATARSDVERLVAYDAPDGAELALPFAVPNPHQFGGPLTLMVVDGQPGDEWYEVQLPIRPNGTTGWIPAASYELSPTRVRATVDLALREVIVTDGGVEIARTIAVVGADDTPTPLGTFYVAATRVTPPGEDWLGPVALVLSSYSEAIPSFSGGLPVIAIHGTNRPDQLGSAISFGCVRIPNDVIEFLAEHVPLGAPVDIVA